MGKKEFAIMFLLEKQNKKCKICGIDFKIDNDKLKKIINEGKYNIDRSVFGKININTPKIFEPEFEVDHIVPSSKNGINNLSNYQLLCIKCNRKKRDKYVA